MVNSTRMFTYTNFIFLVVILDLNRMRYNEMLIGITALIGIILYIVLFYLAREPRSNLEINPFSAVIFFTSIPFIVFMIVHLCKQCDLLSKGLTTKQDKSVEDFKKDNQSSWKNVFLRQDVNCSQQLSNLIEFLRKEVPESLVFKELNK
jgi:hypothetical protein